MINKSETALRPFFEECERVAVITHINPDGDTLGSAIALATILDKTFNKTVRIFTPNRTPSYLQSIRGFDYVTDFLSNPKDSSGYIKSADLIICVDFYNYDSRTGEIAIHIERNTKAKKIVFDHHIRVNLSLYDLTFCDETNSSTAHLVLQTLKEQDFMDAIDKQVAEALYIGMMTDTGNFSFGNLNSDLYNNIAFLVSKGVDTPTINSQIFNVKKEQALRLISFAVYKKMVVDYSKGAAAISLTKEELLQFKYCSGDTEGLVNIPLSIEGIYNSALFIEQDGYIKISLRSEKDKGADMNQFARKHYVGGGHINAAGAKGIEMSLEECQNIFFKHL